MNTQMHQEPASRPTEILSRRRLLRHTTCSTAWVLVLGVVLSLPSLPLLAARLDDSVVKQIDGVFTEWDNTRSPGCVVGVSRGGQVVFARGYGMSNLEHDVPNTPDSIFHVASISKQFTAAAVALLVADGKLSWSDDIRRYVPELPDYGHTITLAHLVHHTSGLRDQWSLLEMAGWSEDDVITEADVLAMAARQRALNFAPGGEYLYCNTGFTLLAVVVKRVSGQSLRDFTAARIFALLDMRATHFHNDHTEVVRGRTSAYQPRTILEIPCKYKGPVSLFTSSPRRVENLVAACQTLERGHGLFLFADRHSLAEADPLAYDWKAGRPHETARLLDF